MRSAPPSTSCCTADPAPASPTRAERELARELTTLRRRLSGWFSSPWTQLLLITPVLLGRLLEPWARGRISEANRLLLQLQPPTARVLRQGSVSEIPVAVVAVGDLVQVRPGDTMLARIVELVRQAQLPVQGGYAPSRIRVQTGRPVRLLFHRTDPSSCVAQVIFPDFQRSLEAEEGGVRRGGGRSGRCGSIRCC